MRGVRNDRTPPPFSCMVRMIYSDFREPAASEACDIAFNFLTRSAAIRDEWEAAVFLAEYLTMMVDRGHSNKILMANRAITAYQDEIRKRDGQRLPSKAVPQGTEQAVESRSMEQIFETWLAGRHASE